MNTTGSFIDSIRDKMKSVSKKKKKDLSLDVLGKKDDKPSFFDDLKFK
jgi:hypothetical protein